MASLKDVARLASVSLMTVSRAINNPELLKPETLKQVQSAIDELNYVPDYSARKIRGQGTKVSSIGVLAIDTATTPFSVEMILSIEQTAREFGWSSFVVNLTAQDCYERAIWQLLAQRPDGIIYTTMGLREISVHEKLRDKNLVLANCLDLEQAFPTYIPDDYHGQYFAIKKIIEKGYRNPLCFYIPEESVAGPIRRKAVEDAWHDAGLPLSSLRQYTMLYGDEHYRDIIEILKKHCSYQKADFDVLICGNDRIAFLAYQVLLSMGLQIPEQVAVLGFDNMIGTGELFYPPLTTVQLPHYDLGKEATLHIIQARKHRDTIQLPCHLVERESL
ncbi:LacI family sucrose specific transcriptional regulator [Proteus hauseri ATCC 700826]|uniref:LacI family sucrose specific transcriptional regulator n=1 Tax=Proteus hauseri ATCC 700826 TaxID=1354271 RepID=A0AAJ3LTA5_PROHU|nr:LacI family DNA-binding transcriptional regulator [Proteus hauseri]OAT45438.1 LacI family sucrose specific transcriptional regulator [Proteus hauseri ATCC 700826]